MQKKKNNYKRGSGTNKRQGTNQKRRAPYKVDDISREVNFSGEKIDSRKNDWRWYATNAQLVKDAASFPYGYAVGSAVNLGTYGASTNRGALPGVMELEFAPLVGYSDNPNSPINVASRAIYGDIRATNSGGTNYDPVDLMLYLIAMDSCYMCLAMMKRVYGVMQLYSPVNRYLPQALVRAMGFDFNSLNSNLADFRAAINVYAQKLKALVIPNGMAYMAKHQWMAEGVYQDHPTDKSQLYVFVPHAFYQFQLDEDQAGMLKAVRWSPQNAGGRTVTSAITFMNSLLDPILANQDFTIMSGDILKWRGPNGIVVPTGITETYQVFPVYDDSVLDQINNATALGYLPWSSPSSSVPPVADGQLEIRQSANKSYLVSKPLFRHPTFGYRYGDYEEAQPGRNAFLSNRFVNFMHEGITPEETMEATRLCNIAHEVIPNTETGEDWFRVKTLGSEALTFIRIWQYAYAENSDTWSLYDHMIDSMSQTIVIPTHSDGMDEDEMRIMSIPLRDAIRDVQRLTAFDRHPMIAYTAAVRDIDSDYITYVPFSGFMNDINYYTIVDENDLIQMAEIALLSEFNVRMQG